MLVQEPPEENEKIEHFHSKKIKRSSAYNTWVGWQQPLGAKIEEMFLVVYKKVKPLFRASSTRPPKKKKKTGDRGSPWEKPCKVSFTKMKDELTIISYGPNPQKYDRN